VNIAIIPAPARDSYGLGCSRCTEGCRSLGKLRGNSFDEVRDLRRRGSRADKPEPRLAAAKSWPSRT